MKLLLIVFFAFVSFSSWSQDVIEWRGSDRTGVYNETGILTQWPENGPELLWSTEGLFPGYASVSVKDGKVYTTGRDGDNDVCLAFDNQGKKLWETTFGLAWNKSFPESRNVPTIHDNKLYVASGYGDVACLNIENGEIIWKVEAFKKFEGKTGDWGYSESLLIVDDKVIFTPGGDKTAIVALNKNTGETIWQSATLNDFVAYVSPILIEENGKKIVINVIANYLFGVDASDGSIIFKINYAEISNEVSVAFWDGGPFTNTNTPVYKDHEIYVTSGYDHVGVKFKLTDDLSQIEVVWIDETLDVHHGGVVVIDNYIYGSNWVNNGAGNWCCVNWETGEVKYEEKWKCKGSIIANDDQLYIYDEKTGFVGLVNVNPEKFDLVSSFKIPLGKGPHWSHPVISNGVLYIRHMDALMAFNIKQK